LPQDRRAGAAVLELGQSHQLAHVDKVRTILNAHIPNRHAIAFDNLMGHGVPAVPKVRVLCSQVPRAELAFNDLPIGLMVHAPPEFRISR